MSSMIVSLTSPPGVCGVNKAGHMINDVINNAAQADVSANGRRKIRGFMFQDSRGVTVVI